ncbi:hypothetical protein Droror1_Dr00006069 [Drosera rotundifolia]
MSSPTPAPTTPAASSTSPPSSSTTPSAPAPVASSPPPPPPTTPSPVSSPPPPPVTPSPAISPPPPPPATPTPASSPPPPPSTPISPSPSQPATPPPPTTTSSSPPPPPVKSSSPPPPKGSGTVKSPPPPPPPPASQSSNNLGLSTGVLVGIAIGGVVVVVVVLGLLCYCCCGGKRKRRRRDDYGSEGFYPPHPHPPPPPPAKEHWQQTHPPLAEHHMLHKPIHPPPPPPPWHAHPPHRPPTPPLPSPPAPHISSGGSGSNYSGSESNLTPPSPGLSLGFSKSTFSYEELAMATNGFSEANILGQGGFGFVHKGILPNGKEVAVKALKAGSGQGEREFQAEVEIISRVHHKHLVSLVGYCIAGSERMLVYEFVPNNTLEFHLHGKGRPTMTWPTRLKIAIGAAKGLAYLHEDCYPKIIHRDIKAANILLDFNFEAKVADFGLAKLSPEVDTHVSTRVMGTFGYLAPEYAASGKLSDKSDVFSYGIVLLELITGRKPIDPTRMDDCLSLADWARPILYRPLEGGDFDSLVDPQLQGDYDHAEMLRMVSCAAACIRHSGKRRPRMSQIVRALEGHVSLSDLNEGIRPLQSTMHSSFGSSDYDTNQYNEELQKFRKTAFASREHGSSEYGGGTTSEYGLNPSGSSSEAQTSHKS